MDKTRQYRSLLKILLAEYQSLYSRAYGMDVETSIVADEEHDYYFLVQVGWERGKRIRHNVGYVRLRNGKFWIEEDRTEDGIVTDLLAKGVPNDDIVLAFNPPEMRQLTEFAAA